MGEAREVERLRLARGADHFTILEALARPEGVLMRAFLAMFGALVGGPWPLDFLAPHLQR